MTIGGGLALIILGAILAFAVEFDVAGLDINTIGMILMLGGAVGLVFGLVAASRRRVVRRGPSDTVVEEREVP